MTDYIAYDNKIETATVTVTSEASGFAKENAYDWLTRDWWKAAAAGTVYFTVDFGVAVSIDYWAVGFTDLADNSGSIKPQYSATGAWAGEEVDFDSLYTPAAGDSAVKFRKLTAVSARYWRFVVSSTGNASAIGLLMLGQALTLPTGVQPPFSPPNFARKNKVFNNRSEAGAFLGRSLVRKGAEFSISKKNIDPDWMRNNFPALADHIEVKPFLYCWNYENHANETAYCWLQDGQNIKTQYSGTKFMSFDLKVEGIYEL